MVPAFCEMQPVRLASVKSGCGMASNGGKFGKNKTANANESKRATTNSLLVQLRTVRLCVFAHPSFAYDTSGADSQLIFYSYS